MCIVCEIKSDLKGGNNEEAIEKVEALAGAVYSLSEEMLKTKGIFKAEVMDKARSAREVLLGPDDEDDEPAGLGLLGLLLAAMTGNIEAIRVEVRPGESEEDAIKRTIAENEAKKAAKPETETKH